MIVLGIETTCDETAAAVVERGLDHLVERLDMGARGDLRHHPAEGLVLLELRQDHVRADRAVAALVAFDHGRRRLVASRLDSEYKHRKIP